MWRETVASAGAPGVVFYELRHYYASALGWMSRSVRRVLFRVAVTSRAVTVIHLDRPLLTSSSALPAGSDGPSSNACCLGLLQVGFT